MEFDAAKGSLKTLVHENFDKTKVAQPLVQLDASGHGNMAISRSCSVAIKVLSAKLV